MKGETREALGSLRDLALHALREEPGTVTRDVRDRRDERDAWLVYLVDLVFPQGSQIDQKTN